MGIWKQRIDESWLKCMGESSGFKIINAVGGPNPSKMATALSLKHTFIDSTKLFNNPKYIDREYPDTTFSGIKIERSTITGLMKDGVGANVTFTEGTQYSYILDYYFGPAITDTKKFSFRKNYQFKTHTYNFAYANNRAEIEPVLNQANAQIVTLNLTIQIEFTNYGTLRSFEPKMKIYLKDDPNAQPSYRSALVMYERGDVYVKITPETGYEGVTYTLVQEVSGNPWLEFTNLLGTNTIEFDKSGTRSSSSFYNYIHNKPQTFYIKVAQEFKFKATLIIYYSSMTFFLVSKEATFAPQSLMGSTFPSTGLGNGRLYNSYLNIFKNALGINPTWEDPYYFDVPYYKKLDISDKNQPTMHILYYYSSPSVDTDSELVSFTNILKSSKEEKTPTIAGSPPTPATYRMNRISAAQSVYAAGYGIAGFEINEIGWKIQGYSFASYDNDPGVGDYTNQRITNYYSGYKGKQRPIKDCVFGKGWYYDDTTNEYTWYDQQFNEQELNSNNNPVGGDSGRQESNEGYRSKNYIAKYIPFGKFNLSFLYECLRSDSGIKLYLSPTLPNSSPSISSKYSGRIIFPDFYFDKSTPLSKFVYDSFFSNNSEDSLTLVNSKQLINDGLPLGASASWLLEYPNSPYLTYPQVFKNLPGVQYKYTNSPIDIYAQSVKTEFSSTMSEVQLYGKPIISIEMPTTQIEKGSVVYFYIMSREETPNRPNGYEVILNRSYTIQSTYPNFQAAWDSEVKNMSKEATSHPQIYQIDCYGSGLLVIEGLFSGNSARGPWTAEVFGRVYSRIRIEQPTNASRSSMIMDSNGIDPNKALVNNINVGDLSSDLVEIRVNMTIRHTYIGDLIINLRVPNGNVINLKAKGSGKDFNDLKNITFTTSNKYPKMQELNFWPGGTSIYDPVVRGQGYVYDPVGISAIPGGIKVPAYPVKAPWLQSPYNFPYNFDWSQLSILPGLTFQMDKINGQGTIANLSGFNNIYKTNLDEEIDFLSNINDLNFILNEDGTFAGTYSLYIKDDTGGNTGLFEDWNIEFIYKKFDNPILSLTQSDPGNEINPGNPKHQYLFGIDGNQYLIIVGDKVNNITDPHAFVNTPTGTASLLNLKASLSNLKIDGGYHIGNNKMYQVNDFTNNNPLVGNNTFTLSKPIENVSYTAYVGYGNIKEGKISIGSINAKIGNGKFLSGIWENGAWNSGWRKDESLQEFYGISDFFSYNRDKRWRFSIEGSTMAVSKFEVGDKVSIGNIVAIDVNEERKLIKNYFTIMAKGENSIEVEFEIDFPIRRIKIDSDIHRIYITKNVWLTGGFFNGYFTGIWNHGLFKGFPYITEMFNSQWIDGRFEGGHFQSRKKSMSFSNTYQVRLDRPKVGISFDTAHKLAAGDSIVISSTFSSFGSTTVLSVTDDWNIITDINWDASKDPNTYGTTIVGTIATNISTGLVQNIDFSAKNVSNTTSLQSMDSTRVFIYDSWMDVNFDNTSAVNIGKPQSTIDNYVSSYAYSDNNLYGYPTYDILSSNVTFRDSFSNTVRNYRLGSKYKIYEDYVGNAGNFDEYFDITGWATKSGSYKTNTAPFSQTRAVGETLPKSLEFDKQGWVINKDSSGIGVTAGISFERTTEALDETDPAAGKEMRVNAVGKGGVLNIQPSYDITNRTNSPIERQRYTIISFDMIQTIVPNFVFEDGNKDLYDYSTKYQPLIHFNNLNYALRNSYITGKGYRQRKLDSTYLPVYKNVNHAETAKKSKIEYFYNKTNLSMFFRGNGVNGKNVSTFVLDNLKLYEVDMIPFFQYFTEENINRSISVPYQAIAPDVEYSENYSLLDSSLYGLDSFYIYQPTNETIIEPEYVETIVVEALEETPATIVPVVPEIVTPIIVPPGSNFTLDFTLEKSCPLSGNFVNLIASNPNGGTSPYRFSLNTFDNEIDALAVTDSNMNIPNTTITYLVEPAKTYYISIMDQNGNIATRSIFASPCNTVTLTRTAATISKYAHTTSDLACRSSQTERVYIEMKSSLLGVSKDDTLFSNETSRITFKPAYVAGGITPDPWYKLILNRTIGASSTSCSIMSIKVDKDGIIQEIKCCTSSGETGEGGF